MPSHAAISVHGRGSSRKAFCSQLSQLAQMLTASQLAFSEAGTERKKPGKYLCKLNEHVLHIPISISGP
jgi:hypothetical protein